MKMRFAFVLTVLPLVDGCALETAERRFKTAANLVVVNDELFDDEILNLDSEQETRRRGEWIEKGGFRICDGYVTRNEGVDFCSSTVPRESNTFKYDDYEYYYQLLEGG